MMKTLYRAFNTGSLILVLVVGAYYGMIEAPYLSYPDLPFKVLTPQVQPGQAVLLEVRRCNSDHRPRVYSIAHQLVGEGLPTILLPVTQASIVPGCTTATSAINVVPPKTAPGIYHVEGSAEVQGTVRTELITWYSGSFEVMASTTLP
jgi:hypothetical protein